MKKTKTQKVIDANERQTNWAHRLLIKKLRNEGLSYQKIASHISQTREKPIGRAAIYEIYKKVENMTIEDIENKLK